jgi:uncharacterized membrane protein
MKLLRVFFTREMAAPMMALTFASTASVAMVVGRMVSTHNLHYGILIWNLFLAWLPLIFALFACHHYQNSEKPTLAIAALAGAWLLFFPNAPYIFTDLIHLTAPFHAHYWVDLTLILMCALTGLVIGFLSLYLMQSIVVRMFGRVAGWVFIAVATGLGGFGIYLGRFLRFNSWDVFVRPAQVYQRLGVWSANPAFHPSSISFPILFALFLFTAYLMLYALTRLSPAPQAMPSRPAGAAGAV